MRELSFDAVVIGAGAAGMAASVALGRRGRSCALVDREEDMGGILLQCIHNGFGLHRFGEELTGPEFAARLEAEVRAAGIPFYSGTTVLSIEPPESADLPPAARRFRLLLSSSSGITRVECRAVVLAMGSRERNRGNVRIAGDRPAGVFTAGLAQRLINIEGYLPGRTAVIVGSGDIGLIMARRLTLSGARVAAVIEIQAFPSGLTRNVVQCLSDYQIPLYLSHATLRIIGRDRVTGVEIAPLENGAARPDKACIIDCDTVLLSVGLVPENELSSRSGVLLNPATNGPVVDSRLMTGVEGIFAAGNVLHIHDLADRASEEAERAGSNCADWLDGLACAGQSPLRCGVNVRYAVPSSIDAASGGTVSLRSMVSADKGTLRIVREGVECLSRRLSWIRPGEMICLDIPAGALPSGPGEFEIRLNVEGEGIE